MSTLLSSTGVDTTTVTFDKMIQNGFGIVTVMNARVFRKPIEIVLGTGSESDFKKADLTKMKAHDIVKGLTEKTAL